MTAKAQPSPLFSAADATGSPLAGGKVFTYNSGTTTPKATYQDAAGVSVHGNPVTLDAAGRATVYWGAGLYTVRVEDMNGVLQYEVDGFDPQSASATSPVLNLVPNGSFEDVPSGGTLPEGWEVVTYPGGTVAVDGADTRHGASSLLITSPGGAGNGGGYVESARFDVGDGNLEVALVFETSLATLRNLVELLWEDAAGVSVGGTTLYDEQVNGPATWTRLEYHVAPPAAARRARLRLTGAFTGTGAGQVRFDQVRIAPALDTVPGPVTFAADVTIGATSNLSSGPDGIRIASDGVSDRALISLHARDQSPGTRSGRVGYTSAASADLTLQNEITNGHIDMLATGTGQVRAGGSRVLTTADEGTGNQLDADTVDGIHAAQLVRTDVDTEISAQPNLANAAFLRAKNSVGEITRIAGIGADNVAYLGSLNNTATPVSEVRVQTNGVNRLSVGDAALDRKSVV